MLCETTRVMWEKLQQECFCGGCGGRQKRCNMWNLRGNRIRDTRQIELREKVGRSSKTINIDELFGKASSGRRRIKFQSVEKWRRLSKYLSFPLFKPHRAHLTNNGRNKIDGELTQASNDPGDTMRPSRTVWILVTGLDSAVCSAWEGVKSWFFFTSA